MNARSTSTKVSVCIATYNMSRFVLDAVRSALAQTHGDIEVIVSDNASTDDTADRLSLIDDPRLHVHRNERNLGAARNFNLAYERSTGEWIKFLEADDMLEATCVERCLETTASDAEVDVVSVGRTRVFVDGTPIRAEIHPRTVIEPAPLVRARVHRRINEIGTPTDVMLRRTLLDATGGFDPDYGSYLNDWDLWLRCQERARKIAFIAEPLVRVRMHPGQIGATGARSNIDIDQALQTVAARWKHARVLSPLWYQKIRVILWMVEFYLWRGLFDARTREAAGRWDFIARLVRNAGGPQFALGVLYTLTHSPVWLTRTYLTRRAFQRSLARRERARA